MSIPCCSEVTYVLCLKDDCWYVGKTAHLFSRLSSHFSGTGAKWTQAHSPVYLAALYAGDREKEITHKAYSKYGRVKVRGYGRTKVTPLSSSNLIPFYVFSGQPHPRYT